MLVTRCRANRSWAAARAKPLEAALRVLDRPDDPQGREQVERLAEQAPVPWLASRACRSRRAGSASRGRRRDPSRAATSSGIWSGGVAMSASAKMTRSPVAASMPARTAAPLPPCATRRTRRVTPAGSRPARLRPRLDHGDRRRCCRRRRPGPRSLSGRPAAPGAPSRPVVAAAQVPEQLVEAGPMRSASLNAGRTRKARAGSVNGHRIQCTDVLSR